MSTRTVYGNDWSENGWRMVNRDECVIANVPLLYIDTAPIRRGDAATILGAWMAWYDRNVEEIVSPVWGWSATNDVETSNHLSGTALDINAPRYPWGTRVMPADRIAKVRRGLGLFEGTVFWGADWSRADEMHYQMGFQEGDARNAAFAAKLRAGHLGIYGNSNTGGGEPVANEGNGWGTRILNLFGDRVSREDLVKYVDLHTAQILDQLGGLGTSRGADFPGWPQLNNSTVVNALADIGQALGLPGYGRKK